MVQTKNRALDLSFSFAIELVKNCYDIQKKSKEYILTKQLIRSGSSIGANLEEAIGGQSDKDFLAKIFISYKEARETRYWLRLLFALDFIDETVFDKLSQTVSELIRILGSTISTLRKKLNK